MMKAFKNLNCILWKTSIKFVNQAGDFARTLSLKLALGQEISQEDYDTMRTVSASFETGATKRVLAIVSPGSGRYSIFLPRRS